MIEIFEEMDKIIDKFYDDADEFINKQKSNPDLLDKERE